ncbi:hypothetical protein WA158_004696 [Blastocystis sp. Blastoise]
MCHSFEQPDDLVTLLGKYLHIIYPKNTLEAQFNQVSSILKLCCEQNQDLKISLGKMLAYVVGTGVSCILEIEDKQEQGIQLCYCLLLLVVVTPSSPSSLLPSLPLLHSYLTNDICVSPVEQESIRDVLQDIIQKLVKKEWSSSLCSSICSSLYSIIGTCPQIKLIDKTVSTLVTIISTLNLSPKPLWTLLQAYIQPLYIPKGTKIVAVVLNSQFPTKQMCVTVVGALLMCNSSYSLSIPPRTISPANLYPAIYSLLLPYLSSLTSPPLYLATLKEITAGMTRLYNSISDSLYPCVLSSVSSLRYLSLLLLQQLINRLTHDLRDPGDQKSGVINGLGVVSCLLSQQLTGSEVIQNPSQLTQNQQK